MPAFLSLECRLCFARSRAKGGGMNRIALYFFMLLQVLVSSCRKDEHFNEMPLPLVVEIHEVFQNNSRHIKFRFLTQEEYPCSNFELVYYFFENNTHREIFFRGIRIPSTCITSIGPATAAFVFYNMGSRNFDLDFVYGKNKKKANITIAENEFRLDIQDTFEDFLIFPDKKITRVPDNYFWGYITPVGEANEQAADDFMKQVLEAGGVDPELEEGHYGFFRIHGGNIYSDPYNLSDHFNRKCFLFQWQEAFEILEEIAKSYGHILEIQIFSPGGHDFNNQM
jgi:hypothetical protein